MPSDSALFFAGAWFTALIVTVILAWVLWLRLNDRTYLYYGAYVGMIAVMSLADHLLAHWFHEHMGDAFVYLNNFLHLPYAIFYLYFVIYYFNVRKNDPGWCRYYSYLIGAYVVTLGWLIWDILSRSSTGSEWAILTCNLVNLLSSLVLAGITTHEDRPGAREFLFASLPLTVSGLVLVAQFFSGAALEAGPGMMAFRSGFILHVMVFLTALSARYRNLRRYAQ